MNFANPKKTLLLAIAINRRDKMSTEDTIEIEYTPKHCVRKSCFHIPKSIMGSEAVPLFMPLTSYIYNDVEGGSIIVTSLSGDSFSRYDVVMQYVHKNLGKRVCTSRITDAQTINSEEGFNHCLKGLLHLAQKYMSEGERIKNDSRLHRRQMLLAMSKQAKYMALYYRLEFMSTEGELFRRKWRQFELFRKKAKELE